MKTKAIVTSFVILLIYLTCQLYAQVSINNDNTPPHNSAMLDVKSTTRGVLIPQMSQSQIQYITNPANGLLVFCTTDDNFYAYIASANVWKQFCYCPGTITPFICGNPFTDTRDQKVYNTVLIGSQCWMAQNLNVGAKISNEVDQTNNSIIEKYCYDNNDGNCATYGGLYMWDELMNYTTSSSSNPSNRQGICPPGWHLPSDAEWCQMETYLDVTVMNCPASGMLGTDVGGKMKETGTSHWISPNTGATNTSGFTALPSGRREKHPQFPFNGISQIASFWSSTESSTVNAWDRDLMYNEAQCDSYNYYKTSGYSGRCVKD
jgi:uncharacterized protein (TIGR02145 family)